MILLCEVIFGDLVLQYSRWFGPWGHVSVDLRQELIGHRCVCVCVFLWGTLCSKLWFVVRWMACSQRQECGRYVCLCLFSYQSFNPPSKHTHAAWSFWRKWGGGVVFSWSNSSLQEHTAKCCHPLLHCSAHLRETSTCCQILPWKDYFLHHQWYTLNIDVPVLCCFWLPSNTSDKKLWPLQKWHDAFSWTWLKETTADYWWW